MPATPTLTELYRASLAADAAWQAELERLFGKRAGDVRYTALGRIGPTLAPLYAEQQRASNAYVKAQIAELLD
jgi:hypothetical protein